MICRRRFMTSALSATAAVAGLSFFSQGARAQEKNVDIQKLMEPGPLPEQMLGDPKAPVTVVEYASLTCSHCAAFHATGFKTLKDDYIDQGKVLFVFREFPLDVLAAGGFMLARNAPGNRYFEVVDLLFERQQEWAYSDNPVEALRELSKQFGYSPKTFEETLSDQALLDKINATRNRATETFGVDSTPTFFINGKVVRGALSSEQVKKEIDPLLAG